MTKTNTNALEQYSKERLIAAIGLLNENTQTELVKILEEDSKEVIKKQYDILQAKADKSFNLYIKKGKEIDSFLYAMAKKYNILDKDNEYIFAILLTKLSKEEYDYYIYHDRRRTSILCRYGSIIDKMVKLSGKINQND